MTTKIVQPVLIPSDDDDEEPTIVDLGVLRRAMEAAEGGLADAVGDADGDDARVRAARDGAHRAAHAYVLALERFAPQVQGTLFGEVSQWAARLQRGWMMGPSGDVLTHFERLLAEYEALCDLMLGVREVERYRRMRRERLLLRHGIQQRARNGTTPGGTA